jgi:PAS domain S-box-containing protein
MTSPESHTAQSSFEALAESAPDAILTIDENSIILTANPATERVFGYATADLVGQRLSVLIPERLRAAHDHGIARYLRTGRRNIPWTGVELQGLHKDGWEFPVEISFGEFVDDSGRRVFSGFVRDISERARQRGEVQEARAEAERALRELDRVSSVIDAPLGKSTYDTMIDDLLARLTEAVEADAAALLLVDEKDNVLTMRAAVGLPIDLGAVRIPIGQGVTGRVAQTGEPFLVGDAREQNIFATALGRPVASVGAVPIRSDGVIVGVLAVGSDTPQRFDEGDVRLLQLVAERTGGVFARTRLFTELEHRREEAERAVKARDEVLAIVSHDLRNPVNTIVMSASLLSDAEIALTEEQRRTQLGVITRSAHRMNRLIQDLLDVKRIEGGRFEIRCKCEDAGALAAEASEAFRSIATGKEITFECEVAKGLGLVYVDRDRILQLLSNYLNNALKFTSKGGRVAMRARLSESGGVSYAVTDNGPGIAASEMPQVFKRFWQSKRTAHLGSGLGLAIAQGIADAHRGRVAVESTPGVETTFYFELPRSNECGG